MDLSQARHAFVTGGASGIGLGIADALAARGLRVTLADIDEKALDAALLARSERFQGVLLDVRDRSGWQRARTQAESTFGAVDVLANNAGIGPDGAALPDTSGASFDRMIAINLAGVFNGVSEFAAGMRGRGRGHIVNTSSVAGLVAAVPGVSAYAAAKFGVTALSEALHAELAPHGVGVSVLCPGFVATNIVANTARICGADEGFDAGGMPDDALTPGEVGEIVARAIDAGDLHIVTHPAMWPMIAARHEAIAAAFAAASARAG